MPAVRGEGLFRRRPSGCRRGGRRHAAMRRPDGAPQRSMRQYQKV